MAALTAQELEAHAEEAHHRQIKFLAMVAHELRNPLTLGSEFVVTLPMADGRWPMGRLHLDRLKLSARAIAVLFVKPRIGR